MSRMQLGLLGLLVMLVVSVATAATTFAAMPAVTDSAGNVITNHLEILGLKAGNAIFKYKIAGVSTEIVCTHEHVASWVLDKGTLFLGGWVSHNLECTMPKPVAANCVVHNGLILLEAHALILLGGKTGLWRNLPPNQIRILRY